MNRTMRAGALLAAVMAALLAGCAAGGNTAGDASAPPAVTAAARQTADTGAQITLTDMAGREVALDAPAERIVALAAADVEILYAIGAGDALCGRGEYCDYPAEALDVPTVQSGAETNVEQIIALAPDAVVMSKMDQTEEQNDAIQKAGIPVIVTDAQDIAGVYEAIALLGALTGHSAEAETLEENMRTTFGTIEAAVQRTDSTIYFEVSPLEYGLWTAGSGTFMDELAGMLGLTNAFADVPGWAEISEEQVIARNPDYIVTIAMYFGEGPTPEEELAARAGWEEIPAVKERRILNIDSNAVARPGPRLAEAAEALYAWVYGEDAAGAAA